MVQEPGLFDLGDLVACCEHVFGLGDAVEEGEAATNAVVDFGEYPAVWLFVEVLQAVFLESCYGLFFGQIADRRDFYPCGELFEALIYLVVIAVEHYCYEIACGPLFCSLLEQLKQVFSIVVVPQQVH